MPKFDVSALTGDTSPVEIEFPEDATEQEILAFVGKHYSANAPDLKVPTAIINAETGGAQDPWIRTTIKAKEGSSAYGPAQLTKTLAEDYREKNPDLFSPEELSYLDRFIKQGEKFLKYGRSKHTAGYSPKYDYGGQGDLTSDKDKMLYTNVTIKMINHHVQESPSLLEAVEKWRGVSAESDPAYFEKVLSALQGAK